MNIITLNYKLTAKQSVKYTNDANYRRLIQQAVKNKGPHVLGVHVWDVKKRCVFATHNLDVEKEYRQWLERHNNVDPRAPFTVNYLPVVL